MQEARLTEGPVARTLVKLSAPMVVAMFAMVGFNIVDTFYVGRLGTEQLAAMGFTLPVVLAVNSISLGIGVGTTATVSQAIGRRDTDGMSRLALSSLLLGVAVSSAMAAAGLFGGRAIFAALGARDEVLDYVLQYMSIWFIGLPFIVIPQNGNSSLRAAGDTKTPMKIMLTVLGLNAVLDPLLIFGWGPVPAYGLRGAAIATVFSQVCAMAVALMLLRSRGIVKRMRLTLAEVWSSWKRVLKVGLPAAITQMITPASTGVITAIVAGFGVAAVAGFGVATRLESFAVMVINAIGAALVPFVGQNWGAGRKDRVSRAVKTALFLAAGWGAFVWLLSLVSGRPVAAIFNDEPAVVSVVIAYMAVVFPSYAVLGALVTTLNAFNALHHAVWSMLLSVLRMFVLYVPLAYVWADAFGSTGVWWAASVANVLAGVVAVFWFRHVFRQMEALPPPETWDAESEYEAVTV